MSERVSMINQLQKWQAIKPISFPRTISWLVYGQTVIIVTVCTAVASVLFPRFEAVNLIMIYLLGVVFTAARLGRGPSIFASFLSVAAFDFFFVPPYLTFAVADPQYLITFAGMLVIALLVSDLTIQIRQQANAARDQERVTATLYALSDEFAKNAGTALLARTAVRYITDVVDSQIAIFLPDENQHLAIVQGDDSIFTPHEQGVAQWVFEHGQLAGRGTDTLPSAEGMYLPLSTSRSTVGVLGISPARANMLFTADDLQMLSALASQTALAIERSHLAEETERVKLQIEAERLRNALLSSVSHDIRTPLASVTGAVSSLLENEKTLSDANRHELAQVAYEESKRLNQLVGNILQMTRLEAGSVHVNREWQPLEEVIGITLNHLNGQTANHPIKVHLPDDLPIVPIDGILMEQVLINLFENAIKYTPSGTSIELSARDGGNEVVIEIADSGPGIAPGDENRVFEKFYRAHPANTGGVGLGLTICRGIVEAHGGHIWAQNHLGAGASFFFTLPLPGQPPEIVLDE